LGAEPTEGVARSVRPGLDLALLPNDGRDLARRCLSLGSDAQLVLLDVPSPPAAAAPLLRCADQVILLVRAGKDALTSLARDLGLVTEVLAGGGASLKVTGLLVTLADPNLASFERFLVQAERAFPVEVLPYCVPRANGCDEESDLVVESAATGRRARAYVELAMEVLEDG
jgi:cellulose biosynthesis protein BcsQ